VTAPPAPRRLLLALGAVAALVLGGCGGEDVDPDTLLAEAKETLDRTESVSFELTGENVPDGGTRLRGGQGDLVRPDGFRGSMQVTVSGFAATVDVRSSGGVFEAQLPFTEGFTETDPAELGFGDPAALLDPDTGISTLLTDATESEVTGQVREGDEVLDTVTVTLPGERVADLLTSADPASPVTGEVSIVRESREVRTVRLTGPFYEADVDSTFVLVLDDYGVPVDLGDTPG
jgi:hypothetical protein